ncbi:hypothetical protein [Neisseria leonii]|uniref:hypothetical protein n=1 Tax=Neisseria leonii TaxID=2995413 RepID=UPI00237A784E|nr:hypothetical protein [Neisseria sp. 3986]MDD9325652.1 hypothetical protein [Neisseria sp. 3986]
MKSPTEKIRLTDNILKSGLTVSDESISVIQTASCPNPISPFKSTVRDMTRVDKRTIIMGIPYKCKTKPISDGLFALKKSDCSQGRLKSATSVLLFGNK